MIAADELHCRGWMYHKRLRMWMLPLPNTLPQKSARGERGSFVVFNPSSEFGPAPWLLAEKTTCRTEEKSRGGCGHGLLAVPQQLLAKGADLHKTHRLL